MSPDDLPPSGFTEVDHTADWAFQVWAPTLEDLFVQAAIALTSLADIKLAIAPRVEQELHIQGVDAESLLVAWLNELLYLRESENIGFDAFEILNLDPQDLRVRMSGGPVEHWIKAIKAVTYHNLSIVKTTRGLEATVVLDV